MKRHSFQGAMMVRTTGDCNNIFAVNPLRRSAWIVSVCWAMLLGPIILLQGDHRALALIGTGWIAATGIIICTPILIWCLVEEAIRQVRRRTSPSIDELDLSLRAANLLHRHGFETVASVESASDATLMLLPNMDARALQEIRRSISTWRYLRWQERGFPADQLP